MNRLTALKIILLFSVIGVLFSGYLTFSKLLSGTCIIAEGCPYFLGYPACAYGLFMYLILAIASGSLLFAKPKNDEMLVRILLIVSLIGVIFSAYFTATELPLIGVVNYTLLLPTCVYGLFMYLIILAAALLGLYRKSK